MAYNVFYTSVPVLVSVIDKDLSETTVMQHPQILFYCQAGRYALTNFVYKSALFHRLMHISVYSHIFFSQSRLLNPSTFAGWFGRSLFHVSSVISNLLKMRLLFIFPCKKKKNLKTGILFAGDCCICNNYSRICL